MNIDYSELAIAVVADECKKDFFFFVKTFCFLMNTSYIKDNFINNFLH